jgi:hypothetical protein
MFMNVITQQWIDAYVKHPKTAVIIESEDELSHAAVVEYLHDSLIGNSHNPLVTINSEDKNSIGVDKIRQLKRQLSLQANASDSQISRMVVIEQAQRMTDEAQNALLKLIEELPARTVICLTVDQSSNLLATVSSRCFHLRVLPIEKNLAMKYAAEHDLSTSDAEKLYMISGGYPGLYKSLVEDEKSDITLSISEAKKFLTSNVFDRQKIVQSLAKEPETIALYLRSLRTIALAGLRTSTGTSKSRWMKTLSEVAFTERQLSANVSTKLALLRLSISI